jgi:hypothetical protein
MISLTIPLPTDSPHRALGGTASFASAFLNGWVYAVAAFLVENHPQLPGFDDPFATPWALSLGTING